MWICLYPGCATRPKVHNLATRYTCMDGGCISNKVGTPKSIRFPTVCSYRESVNQSNERQVCIQHNNTSTAFPTMIHPVIENIETRYNFHSTISKYLLTRPNENQTLHLCENQTLALTTWKVSGNSILQKTYQTKQLICSQKPDTLHHYKTGWRMWSSWFLSKKLIFFMLV